MVAWHMPVISALGKLRQEHHQLEASLVYIGNKTSKQENPSILIYLHTEIFASTCEVSSSFLWLMV
jgi:hypothetical protein